MRPFLLAPLMVGTLSKVSTLLLASAILLAGHGLQLTLLPVHALDAGWTAGAVGVTGSFYFIGFVAGCVVVPAIVAEVGHIRSFMVMAAIATVALLCAGLFINFWAWLLFRGTTGFALAGLYMSIESWLGDVTPRESRGAILAIYSVISLAGMGLGQVLLGLGADNLEQQYLLAATLLSLAIVPVGLTHVVSPHPLPSIRFNPGPLFRASSVAVVCAFLAGAVTGAFWAIGPLLGGAFGADGSRAGLLMGSGILGAVLCHLPAGRLSDRHDRRIVVGVMALLGAAASLFGWLYAAGGSASLYVAFFLLGATSMPLYALCIALAGDQSELPLIEIASGILLIHGLGSITGPLVAAAGLARFGSGAYFVYTGFCLAMAALWTGYQCVAGERHVEREIPASILPRTTQAVAELAPATGESETAP